MTLTWHAVVPSTMGTQPQVLVDILFFQYFIPIFGQLYLFSNGVSIPVHWIVVRLLAGPTCHKDEELCSIVQESWSRDECLLHSAGHKSSRQVKSKPSIAWPYYRASRLLTWLDGTDLHTENRVCCFFDQT